MDDKMFMISIELADGTFHVSRIGPNEQAAREWAETIFRDWTKFIRRVMLMRNGKMVALFGEPLRAAK